MFSSKECDILSKTNQKLKHGLHKMFLCSCSTYPCFLQESLWLVMSSCIISTINWTHEVFLLYLILIFRKNPNTITLFDTPFSPQNFYQLKKFLEGAQRPRNSHTPGYVCINVSARVLCSRSEIKYHKLLPNLSYYHVERSPGSIKRTFLICIYFPSIYITNCP